MERSYPSQVEELCLRASDLADALDSHLAGRNFQNSESLSCRFGGSTFSVSARYLTSRTLECVAPAHGTGSVQLQVSLNGQQFASIGVSYTYHHSPIVASIVPFRGSPMGGTLTELFLSGTAIQLSPWRGTSSHASCMNCWQVCWSNHPHVVFAVSVQQLCQQRWPP